MNVNIFLLLISLFSTNVFSQPGYNIPKSYGFILGANGLKYNNLEFGIAKGLKGNAAFSSKRIAEIARKKSYLIMNLSYFYSQFEKQSGLSAGFSISCISSYSIDFNYNSENKLGFKPALGIGIYGFEFLYWYNFRLIGDMSNYFGHYFSIRYYIPLFVYQENSYKIKFNKYY